MDWQINTDPLPLELFQACSFNQLVTRILFNRGIKTVEDAEYYLPDRNPQELPPEQIPNLASAVERIQTAIKSKQKIVVFGDYDVDGTTSTALLVSVLRSLDADCDFIIPNRFTDGYGLNVKAIIKAKSHFGAGLLITCDCGITNFAEVSLANSLSLDVIITDHHSLPSELPPAVAVLNPKMLSEDHPLHHLPGVGVAYKLASSLLELHHRADEKNKLLDLVALGIVADLASLRAENRLLAKLGMNELAQTTRPGLKALLIETGNWNDEEGIGFAIGPRINAAGRMADANTVVELLLSTDTAHAQTLAGELSEQNKARQVVCEEIYSDVVRQVENSLPVAGSIIIASESWHAGVVGIVASRVVDRYNIPALIAVEEGEFIKGSARGCGNIDIHHEIYQCADLLEKFGGHKAAAGFTLNKKNWIAFKQKLGAQLIRATASLNGTKKIQIDAHLKPEQLTAEFLQPVFNLAPFGMGFVKPIFSLQSSSRIISVSPLGEAANHSKLNLENSERKLEIFCWGKEPKEYREYLEQNSVELAFCCGIKTFRNRESLRLELKDIKHAQNDHTPPSENSKTNPCGQDSITFLKLLLRQCTLAARPSRHALLNLSELSQQLSCSPRAAVEGLRLLQSTGAIDFSKVGESMAIELIGAPKILNLDTSNLKRELASKNIGNHLR